MIFCRAMFKKLDFYVSVLTVLIFMKISKIGCPILYLTGIPCFGCGMTRACECLLRFDFEKAFYYHPLCYLMPVFLGICLCKDKINKNIFRALLWIAIFLFLLVYAIRIMDPENSLIKPHIKEGLLYKLLVELSGKIKPSAVQ